MRVRPLTTTGLAAALALSFAACKRNAAPPEFQTTTGAQPRQQPTIVTGCLKNGFAAASTFVLTTDRPEAGEAVTYQITGAPDLHLRDQVGHVVEVSGTLETQERVESTSAPTVEKKTTGDGGTPVVETKTDLNVNRLRADSIKTVGRDCPSR